MSVPSDRLGGRLGEGVPEGNALEVPNHRSWLLPSQARRRESQQDAVFTSDVLTLRLRVPDHRGCAAASMPQVMRTGLPRCSIYL